MFKFFLLPLVLSILWFGFLQYNNWSIQQGKKGFIYIIGGTTGIIAFLSLMIYLTR
ncbi:hypothetical protein HWV01_19625 [Moritella sp. 5]|uniref:hypothetical protein n=1 Tax=Moritella sp. 5 TaxID=2746231 RepID=UPI001BA66405|nr:hypothetical protein [Moritella sp. 5]QUM82337.1 hypothetical protein HWV01_19625 [Moritella sp. 5]